MSQETIGFTYHSPVDGAKFVNTEQVIILRTGHAYDVTSLARCQVSIIGSDGGEITSSWSLSADRKTLFLQPDKNFSYGETVTVMIPEGLLTGNGQMIEPATFRFQTEPADNTPLLKKYYALENEKMTSGLSHELQQKSGLELPENNYPAKYPAADVVIHEDPAPGYIFNTPMIFFNSPWDPYMQIIDNQGIPVFFRKMPNAIDLKLLPDGNLCVGTWNFMNPATNFYYIMDSSYNMQDTIGMGNGYHVDTHDILLLENGHYVLMAYDPQPVDMSQIVPGGDTNATVIGLIIQEVDSDANVYFQWSSWDHIPITDATDDIDLTAASIDYIHGNAFDLDHDGHLLVSSRNLDEITKIDFITGDVIWRMGLNSKGNMFTFTNDTIGFSHQHDIRRLPNGNYTLYDNGNLHDPPFSQALEYSLDQSNLEATLVWSYRDAPDTTFGFATGSHRRLDNGNSIICWGAIHSPAIVEVTPDGQKMLEIHQPQGAINYRAIKEQWKTNRFSTSKEVIDFGEFTGYTPVPRIFSIHNPGVDTLSITSTFNHLDHFSISTAFPIVIPPGESSNMTVNFFPAGSGNFRDVLTINSDNADTTMRIARQVVLLGSTPDNEPPSVSFDPEDDMAEVLLNANVLILFDEPVFKTGGEEITNADIASMVIFKMTDENGVDVEFTGSIDDDKTMITLDPVYDFEEFSTYYVKLNGGSVEDGAGNVLEEDKTCTFITGDIFGIEEPGIPPVEVYPNPAGQFVTIKSGDTPGMIRLYDLQGKTLIRIDEPRKEEILHIGELASGLYMVDIRFDNDRVVTGKVYKK